MAHSLAFHMHVSSNAAFADSLTCSLTEHPAMGTPLEELLAKHGFNQD